MAAKLQNHEIGGSGAGTEITPQEVRRYEEAVH
jgi:hypothetical protein